MIHDRTRPLRPSGRVTMTTLASIAAAGIAVALGAAPRAPVKDGQATVPPDLIASVKAALGLTAGTIVGLDLDDTPSTPLQAVLPLDGQPVTLDLAPYSVRSANYQVLVQVEGGQLVPAPPAPIRTLRGVVAQIPGSTVAGSRLEDGLHAMITLPDGNRYWVQPIAPLVAGAPEHLHVVYHDEDVLPILGFCGTNDKRLADAGEAPLGGGGSGADPCGANPLVAELGCDAGVEYFNDHGSVTAVQSRINLVINTVNNQYENDVDISHEITTIIVRTSEPDPYSSTSAGTLLNQLISEWTGNQAGITRDVVHLFTGKNLNGGTVGIAADIGGICEFFNEYCLAESDCCGSFACTTALTAHELGHLWGGFHCNCPGFTMHTPLQCGADQFHSVFTIPDIIAHRDSRTCLACPGPVNNLCAIAPLQFAGSTTFTNVSATTDGPTEAASCNFNGDSQIQSDVWYRYPALCDGIATVSLCGSTFDTKLAVYTEDCPAGPDTVIVCNRNFCGQQSEVSFPVISGNKYRIRIGGHQGAQGTGTLTITCVPDALPCPEDVNGDGDINVLDLIDLLLCFGLPAVPGCEAEDVNDDGSVNVLDLIDLLLLFGTSCP